MYRSRYLSPSQLQAMEMVREACTKDSIKPADAALRWLRHHSGLKGDLGDGIIVGASTLDHFSDNVAAASVEARPLPTSVVDAFDSAWEAVRSAGEVPSYERGTSRYS
eukprot:TRINITY_DN48920_c0_g1_i2.p1 TRINITY_DN48920_c0_g1~~TRINITY_DN48920_c0_g1_i2.p1  ORF type:complete len:108 (+),score=21.61 TRINITY_DN48920_c0_g1_i2:218-541(+)